MVVIVIQKLVVTREGRPSQLGKRVLTPMPRTLDMQKEVHSPVHTGSRGV